jgi:hypothetical protein
MPIQFWTFHFSNSSAERPHARKITAAGCATRSNSILSSWYSGPSAPLSPRSAEGLALRRYSGPVNPSSGAFVCWNKISTHQYRQSLDRLLGRAAVMVTRYERIKRMVPHRVPSFIIVKASKIKAKALSFGDRRKMKRRLRKTDAV